MSSAQVASAARAMKPLICSSTPRESQASASDGSSCGLPSFFASASSASTSGNLRENAWLAAAARLKRTLCSPRRTLSVLTSIVGPASILGDSGFPRTGWTSYL